MAVLHHEDALLVENEFDLSESILRIRRHLRTRKELESHRPGRRRSLLEDSELCERLDYQIRFMDNALYFLEEVIPQAEVLTADEQSRCESALATARRLREILELGGH